MPMQVRRWLLGFTPILAAIYVANGLAQQPLSQATFIAVLRPDTLLVPIAIHDGEAWWNPWPISHEGDVTVRSLPVPPSLAEIPAEWLPPGTRFPQEWRLQVDSGGPISLRAVAPGRPTAFDIQELIGVRTDYPVRQDLGGEEIGIAIAGPGELGRFGSPSADESRTLSEQLRGRLRTLEADAIARWVTAREPSDPPIRQPLVARSDPERLVSVGFLKALTPFRGRTYYRVEGSTEYPIVSADPVTCALNVEFSGTIAVESGRIVSDVLSAGESTQCTGGSREWTEVLATVVVRDRFLWVIKIQVEDGRDYALVDPETNMLIPVRGSWPSR
jgi:hypothetical protein